MDLKILFLDNHLLVINKPPGILSQSDITGDEDILSYCKSYIKDKFNKPGKVYTGLVHRLDRPVSGVMVQPGHPKQRVDFQTNFVRIL